MQEAICYAREIPVWGAEGNEETDEDKCLPKEGKALLLSQVRLGCMCVYIGWAGRPAGWHDGRPILNQRSTDP